MPKCKLGLIGFPAGLYVPEVMIHDVAQEELKGIFDRSGNISILKSAYKKRLEYLVEKRQKAVFHTEWFEELKGTDGLFSMRFNRINNLPNLRIIYYFLGDTPYLVVPFIEDKKSAYRNAVDLAQERRVKKEEL